MKSFFFARGKTLYGTLHEPTGAPKELGAVLCCAGPQEYHMTYWAFRRLAQSLARAGVSVLRFDYSCTGDSQGEATDGRLDRWSDDIVTAASELKELTGTRKLALIGLRLGAALATRAVAKGLKANQLVLWEPVVSGPRYLEQLEELDSREALRLFHRVTGPRLELGGYPMGSAQREEYMRLDLGADVPRAAQRVLFACQPAQVSGLAPLSARWTQEGVACGFSVAQDVASVTDTADRDTAVMYTAALQAMTKELTGAAA